MTDETDGIPSAYRPLYEFLRSSTEGEVVLPLRLIESLLGLELPPRAHSDSSWWSSTPRNSWARSWMKADRTATLRTSDGSVAFAAGSRPPRADRAWQVAQRRREENHARESLSYGPGPDEIQRRWWEPHLVYVLHVHVERLYKVGLTRHDSERVRTLTARGRADIVETLLLPNRHAARLVEIAVLDATESVRRIADRYDSRNGQTEHWDDSMPPPALEPIGEKLSQHGQLRSWFITQIGESADE